jgi:hypothetical protein
MMRYLQPVGCFRIAFGVTSFNSTLLNENQLEDTQYGVLALQRSINGFDGRRRGDAYRPRLRKHRQRQSLANGRKCTASDRLTTSV